MTSYFLKETEEQRRRNQGSIDHNSGSMYDYGHISTTYYFLNFYEKFHTNGHLGKLLVGLSVILHVWFISEYNYRERTQCTGINSGFRHKAIFCFRKTKVKLVYDCGNG